MEPMRVRNFVAAACTVVAAAATAVATPVVAGFALPRAAAECPDAELIFARGRLESTAAGRIGDALYAALVQRTAKSVGLYGVNYPADNQIEMGANDMSRRVQEMVATCPDTKLVLGGYSLGAAAADVVLAVSRPMMGFKKPLPAGAEPHIAAVALFGNGTQWLGPIGKANPVYNGKIIEQCHAADPVCTVTPNIDVFKANWNDHLQAGYIDSGMVNQAADFIAARINS
jgi:cutinase